MKAVQVRLTLPVYNALAAYAHIHRLTLGGAGSMLLVDGILGRASNLPPAPQADSSGFVYLIKAGQLCKIGKAVDVAARIKALHLPSKPVIIATKKSSSPFNLERALHKEFAHLRRRGEWFALGAAEIKRARSMLADWAE